MKKLSIIVTLFMMASIVLTSCGKYEEGPGFSVLPKKSRVVNIWKVDKTITKIGSSTTEHSGDANYSIEFKSDGTYETTWTTVAGSFTSKGKWNFDSKKENLEVQEDNSSTKSVSKILMLKSDEMWLTDESNSLITETHFVTK